MGTPDEMRVGPLVFVRETSDGMSVATDEETLGYCEGVTDSMWTDFASAAGQPPKPRDGSEWGKLLGDLTDLLELGVTIDGHHKQWVLEIAARLCVALPDHEDGIAP